MIFLIKVDNAGEKKNTAYERRVAEGIVGFREK